MNITRGGYALINLDNYSFEFTDLWGEKTVTVEKDIIELIKYAYAVGKPVCVNNIHRISNEQQPRLYTAVYGTVTPVDSDTYHIPYLTVDVNNNTLTWDGGR